MKNYLLFVAALVFLAFPFLFSTNIFKASEATSTTNNIVSRKDDSEELKKKFLPAKKMLLAKGVTFDPEILLLPNWRKQIASNLTQMEEMQTTLKVSDKLQGAQIADTIILPEKVELIGDVVILANTIVYEGRQTVIEGVGKNVFIFPVKETFHIGNTFEEAFDPQGTIKRPRLIVNQPSLKKLEFDKRDKKFNALITIRVNGQGREEWLAKQKKIKDSKSFNRSEVNQVNCPPQTPICNGDEGGIGIEGTPGTVGPTPEPPVNGGNGNCSRRVPNGIGGFPGDNGLAGFNDAGKGGRGNTGGTGGTIYYSIASYNPQTVYVFESIGGSGGQGGRGGLGSTGGRGQDGGKGGDGQDCPCSQGGAGNGGDGAEGGRGGKGGNGGEGGDGGDGGRGGTITVFVPYNFPATNNGIAYYVYGGNPGPRGEGGLPGYPGESGEGGGKGRALGNFNCPSTQGTNGRDGYRLSSLGGGESGPSGQNGTVYGQLGTYQLINSPEPTPNPTPREQCLINPILSSEKISENERNELRGACECVSQSEIEACEMGGGAIWDWTTCQCGHSPIVIDVLGNGFNLTNPENGIQFDINGDGTQNRIAWSSTNSDDAWLALDRNNNGLIDDGKELFGNSTQQPAPPVGEVKNGFLALAVFDKTANGGNNDGIIDNRDAVFASLRLWQDVNHNGISEATEMKTLSELGLATIELDYRESKRTDEFGNRFRYRAKVKDTQGGQIGRWAWDVYLVVRVPNN